MVKAGSFFVQLFESMSTFTDLNILSMEGPEKLEISTMALFLCMAAHRPLYDNRLNGGALIGSAIAAPHPPKKFN